MQAGMEPLPDLPSAPLVGLSAAMLLILPDAQAACGLCLTPLILAELAAGAKYGCRLTVVAPAGEQSMCSNACKLLPETHANMNACAHGLEIADQHIRLSAVIRLGQRWGALGGRATTLANTSSTGAC